MRVVVGVLVFLSLILGISDAKRCISAETWQFLTLGEILNPGLVVFAGAMPQGISGVAKLRDLAEFLLATPACPLFAALAFTCWRLDHLFRRAMLHGARKPAGAGAPQLRMRSERPVLRPSPLLTTTRDSDFLPAALEILARPPSPVASAMLLTICGAFVAAIIWAYVGWIDIHAVAHGKVQPSGRSKVVQPLEPGRVVAVRTENGASVKPGEVLLELDPTESGADREALARDLESAHAEVARRRAAIGAAALKDAQPHPISFGAGTSDAVSRREEGVFVAELAQLRSTIGSLKAQLAEKQATQRRFSNSIEARQRLIELSKERVDMRKEIESRGSGSRALIIEALQQYETHVTTDAGERGQLVELDAAIQSLERRMDEARSNFVADQTQKLAEIERKRDRIIQELVKAQSKNERTQLRAPIAGTVQQLSVTTVGQVVSSGQSLLTVVPLDGPIEVESMITNKDIGFVEVGQPAIVKIEAFPFTRYGTINATVAKVSRDAVDDRSYAGLSDVTNATKQQSQPQSTVSAGNLVFPTTITLAQRTIRVDGKDIPIIPGMSVTVEVKTGQRRVIDYILSPVREIAARTAHER